MNFVFFSSLKSIISGFLNLGIRNTHLLDTISESLIAPVNHQEEFLLILHQYCDFCFEKNDKNPTKKNIEKLILKNVWNNKLEHLNTLDLLNTYKHDSRLFLDISNLRKFTKILIKNAYTMNYQELSGYVKVLLSLSETNPELKTQYSQFLTSHLLNYSFEDQSQLVNQEYQILRKTLNERTLLEQKLSQQEDDDKMKQFAVDK